MIKAISVAYRKTGLTPEEFNEHWKNVHGPLAARLIPNLRKYVQNHLITVPGMKYEGDGIVEMWYDNIEDWKKSMESIRNPEARELALDGPKFCEMKPGAAMWIVEEHVIKDELKKK
jgi:uncharacterized protein (TIGR02118 family)